MKKLLFIVLTSYIGSSFAEFIPTCHPCIKFMEELRGAIPFSMKEDLSEEEFTAFLERLPQNWLMDGITECVKIEDNLKRMRSMSNLSASNQKLIAITLRAFSHRRNLSLQASFNQDEEITYILNEINSINLVEIVEKAFAPIPVKEILDKTRALN